jgi:hypothetical protein
MIMNVEANDVRGLEKKGLDRTVWKASVNAGVDVSLVSWSCGGLLLETMSRCTIDPGSRTVSC